MSSSSSCSWWWCFGGGATFFEDLFDEPVRFTQLYRDYFGQYEDPYKFRTIKGWNIRVLTFN